MKRAIVTHFDGDPFMLNFWLILYERYWRMDINTMYMGMVKNKVPKEVVDYITERLKAFPEIKVTWFDEWIIPEKANKILLAQVTEELVGLIESDGFVYGLGVVDQCFRLLEQGQQVVAAQYTLMPKSFFQNGDGFMRCFFFTTKELLSKIDVDFMPHQVPLTAASMYDLDCFGWISFQLLKLNPKITYIPQNMLGPDTILKPYSNFKFVHVRQMMSSNLGIGGGEFQTLANHKWDIIRKLILEQTNPTTRNEFTYVKSIAFRLLFLDYLPNNLLADFRKTYEEVLSMANNLYNLPTDKIHEIKGFYRALFQL